MKHSLAALSWLVKARGEQKRQKTGSFHTFRNCWSREPARSGAIGNGESLRRRFPRFVLRRRGRRKPQELCPTTHLRCSVRARSAHRNKTVHWTVLIALARGTLTRRRVESHPPRQGPQPKLGSKQHRRCWRKRKLSRSHDRRWRGGRDSNPRPPP